MWDKGENGEVLSSGRGETTLIASGTRIVGDIHFVGDLHLEGMIEGNIHSDQGNVCLAESGRIQGEVRAPRVVLNGPVEGNVYSTEQLELNANALISGNVFYRTIEMARGARVNGHMEYLAEESFVPEPPVENLPTLNQPLPDSDLSDNKEE